MRTLPPDQVATANGRARSRGRFAKHGVAGPVDAPQTARKARARPRRSASGISPFEMYTMDEARARLRWGKDAVRLARRNGLRQLKKGKHRFVLGLDLIRYVMGHEAAAELLAAATGSEIIAEAVGKAVARAVAGVEKR